MNLRKLGQKIWGPKAEKPAAVPQVPDWVQRQRVAADRFLAAPATPGRGS